MGKDLILTNKLILKPGSDHIRQPPHCTFNPRTAGRFQRQTIYQNFRYVLKLLMTNCFSFNYFKLLILKQTKNKNVYINVYFPTCATFTMCCAISTLADIESVYEFPKINILPKPSWNYSHAETFPCDIPAQDHQLRKEAVTTSDIIVHTEISTVFFEHTRFYTGEERSLPKAQLNQKGN